MGVQAQAISAKSNRRVIALSALRLQNVDTAARKIYGVAAISIGEAEGHGERVDMRTLETVLEQAKRYPNGVRLENTHANNVLATVGIATNWRIDGEVLRCDVSFLETRADAADVVIELASRSPESFGLSITFEDHPEKIGESWYARCARLYSISLVDVPAANAHGLFGRAANVSNFSAALGGLTKVNTMTYTPEEIASLLDALKAEVESLKASVSAEAEMGKKIEAMSATVSALSAKVETGLTTFGTRAAAIEQQITPKDSRPAELVKFEAAVKDAFTAGKGRITKFGAIAAAARTDKEGHVAWLRAGQPAISL